MCVPLCVRIKEIRGRKKERESEMERDKFGCKSLSKSKEKVESGWGFFPLSFLSSGIICSAARSKNIQRVFAPWSGIRVLPLGLMLISPTLAAGGAVAASQIAAELILTLCQLLRCGFQHVFVCFSPDIFGINAFAARDTPQALRWHRVFAKTEFTAASECGAHDRHCTFI